jgi:hypothetical protein
MASKTTGSPASPPRAASGGSPPATRRPYSAPSVRAFGRKLPAFQPPSEPPGKMPPGYPG